MLKYLLPGLFFFCWGKSIAQKSFSVTLIIPKEWDKKQVVFSYDNGIDVVAIPPSTFINNKALVSGIYYSKYVAVIATYIDYPFIHDSFFFIKEKPAIIAFFSFQPSKHIFDSCSLENAIEFKEENERLQKYDSTERRRCEEFESVNLKKVYEGDEHLRDEYNKIRTDKLEKDMEFIRLNPTAYYLFWYFKRNIAPLYTENFETVWRTFNSSFPDSFKNSVEGQRLSILLSGRINTTKHHTAPDFTTADINRNRIALKDYYDKSYVLLVFWASWCAPCMQEMPVLKSFRKKYSKNDLVMIFFSSDKDSVKYRSTLINNHMMDWINVPRDKETYYRYGYKNYIPQVYLIDNKGQIVYSRNEENDIDLVKLRRLLTKRLPL